MGRHGHAHHDHSHDHGHGHSHGHHHHHHDLSGRNIGWAFLLNSLFVVIELVGGVLTGSVAVLADAVHDLGDSVSLGIGWYLQRLSTRGATKSFSYGYGRFSLLSALISGVTIFVGSAFILVETVPRFWNPVKPHGEGMLLLAALGIAVNGLAALRLSHGKTMNEQTLKWHLIEDAVGWMAVLVGAVVILLTGWAWVDPALAVGVALWVMWHVARSLVNTLRLLLQSAPRGFDSKEFISKVEALEGVREVHDFHVWSIDGARHILSLHVTLEAAGNSAEALCGAGEIKRRIRLLAESQGHYHVTVETEGSDEICSELEWIRKHEGR